MSYRTLYPNRVQQGIGTLPRGFDIKAAENKDDNKDDGLPVDIEEVQVVAATGPATIGADELLQLKFPRSSGRFIIRDD